MVTQLQLRHYPRRWTEFKFEPGRRYFQEEEAYRSRKPKGLWVSVAGEYDWPTWCREAYYTDHSELERPYQVELSPLANIRHMQTYEDLREFTSEFCFEGPYMSPGGLLDWVKVTQVYDGVIISPYIGKARLDVATPWYYSWDCASGCIWNLDAVEYVFPRPYVGV